MLRFFLLSWAFLLRRRRILSQRNVTRGEERGETALLAEATNLTGVTFCWISLLISCEGLFRTVWLDGIYETDGDRASALSSVV